MQFRLSIIIANCAVLIVLVLGIAGCVQAGKDHPAAALQRALATRLEDPAICPGGDSRDIQQLIDSAGSAAVVHLVDGCYQATMTINIPACTQLVGAGADKTILYRHPSGTYYGPILKVVGKADLHCNTQISGLALLGVRDTQDNGEDYGILLTSLIDFRLDHLYLEGFGFAGVRVEGNSSGVIDHAIFIDNFKRAIDNLGYGVVVYGKGTWSTSSAPGDSQATFVEDSLFVGNRHAVGSSAGAHYVFRSNQVVNSIVACALDAHGMGFGVAHGTQFVEIYRNIIEDPGYDECGIGIRGGSGVIFENTIRGYKNPILLILEWGTPETYKAEYPALDQIHDLYIWGNQVTGGPSAPQVDETGVGFIEASRDFFTVPMPGYTPYVYPHPLAQGGSFDADPWPPTGQ
jgi:hypothetical protein